MKVVVVLKLILAIAMAEKVRYDNHQVYNLKVQTVEQLDALRLIEHHSDGYDLWSNARLNNSANLMVSPEKLSHFKKMVKDLKFETKLNVKNVQELIDAEKVPTNSSESYGSHDWTSFQTLEEINAWLNTIIAANPNVLTNHLVGYSFERREIRAVKYSEGPNRPAIFVEANIHAREWITAATATWVINNLVHGTDAATRNLASSFDWYIIPVANPDGYAYTHTTDRLWRKTRSNSSSSECVGADANRNFDFFWMQGGASDDPCSDIYAGQMPFSEPESAAIAKYFGTIASNVHMYLSFHSYSQLLLFPYGHTTEPSWNHRNLVNAGNLAATAISKRYGTHYNIGNIAVAIYIATGSSVDWAFAAYKIPYSYAFEFRGSRDSIDGFMLPADEIIPNSLEAWDGIIALIGYSRENI